MEAPDCDPFNLGSPVAEWNCDQVPQPLAFVLIQFAYTANSGAADNDKFNTRTLRHAGPDPASTRLDRARREEIK